MKNLKKNSLILVLFTAIVLYFVLKDNFVSVVDILKNASLIWLLVAFLLQVLLLIFESLAFHQIIHSYKKDFPFFKTFKLILITKFFNGITPFSTGGQPMQIYFFKKEGFRITKATNMIMQNFILYQFALVSVGTFALIMNHFFHYFEQIPLLRHLVTLGFLINTLVMLGLFIISFSNKFNQFIISKAVTVGAKLKIIKNKEAQQEKWLERCNDFHQGATFIKTHKLLCLKGYVYQILSLLALYITPYFIFRSLGVTTELAPLATVVASSYVLIIGSFVPIPGASGGIEYGFLQFFKNFVVGNTLSAGLLIWRAFTYYLPVIVGAIVLNLRKEH